MLEKLHVAERRQAGLEKIKKEAREETCLRLETEKLKRKQHRVLALSMNNNEGKDQFIEPFKIDTTIETTQASSVVRVFIDMGSDTSIMSYETWEAIGNPELQSMSFSCKSFNNTESTSIGTCYVKIHIQDAPINVANKQEAMERVVLGYYWMWSTKCVLDLSIHPEGKLYHSKRV
ncbi:hypothetical protein GOP47_0025364 [Adiantum capillus-veneris]|uniref:Peptidase A2 domain-containing protein n=1 Tax=Adiantum capillus-veneris TaxID=13818 RepID=A0A9D4U0I5_ADICA|nr:hypothetical protein GOP47_0025364 [Adiantum capillus-veneris]